MFFPTTVPVGAAGLALQPSLYPYGYTLTITTQDAVGQLLPFCGVTVFRTADNSVAAQGVSDSNGSYTVGASSALQHFAVIYKVQGAGLPDIFGTSVNTLVPV